MDKVNVQKPCSSLQTMAKIMCKYCNKEFPGLVIAQEHNCPKKPESPKWREKVGGRKKSEIDWSKFYWNKRAP